MLSVWRLYQLFGIRLFYVSSNYAFVMNKLDYAYDVLSQKEYHSLGFCYTLQIRKYRLNTKNEMITGCITRVPILSDFSDMSDDYDRLCLRYELRMSSKLSPDLMMKKLFLIFADRFLQVRLNLF